MNVGVFGGTFDPPHLAHLVIAERAQAAANLDKVLFLPSPRPPHKLDHILSDYPHRLAMVKLAIQGHPAFELSEIETRIPGPSYTTQTLKRLSIENQNCRWFLIIGADSLRDFHTWREPKKLCRQARFVVYPRSGCDVRHVDPLFLSNSKLLDVPNVNMSSTEIRDRVRAGRSIRDLVPESVAAYVLKNRLYEEP